MLGKETVFNTEVSKDEFLVNEFNSFIETQCRNRNIFDIFGAVTRILSLGVGVQVQRLASQHVAAISLSCSYLYDELVSRFIKLLSLLKTGAVETTRDRSRFVCSFKVGVTARGGHINLLLLSLRGFGFIVHLVAKSFKNWCCREPGI
jgi:hypothetical protein